LLFVIFILSTERIYMNKFCIVIVLWGIALSYHATGHGERAEQGLFGGALAGAAIGGIVGGGKGAGIGAGVGAIVGLSAGAAADKRAARRYYYDDDYYDGSYYDDDNVVYVRRTRYPERSKSRYYRSSRNYTPRRVIRRRVWTR
jgi:hypothetical protein